MSTVKRVLSIILILALSLMSFGGLGGCSGEKKPLRVCVDLSGLVLENDAQLIQLRVDAFLKRVVELGGPEDVEVEYVPDVGDMGEPSTERASAITRLRTEIMAGGGPDVFLMACAAEEIGSDGLYTPENAALFRFPDNFASSGRFLSLDSYIEDAQFMEWEKLTPAVMAAGSNEQYGQCILPLAYSFPVSVFSAEDAAPPQRMTYAEMLESGDPVLETASVGVDGSQSHFGILDSVLGPLSKSNSTGTGTGTLLFTEEDLYDALSRSKEANSKAYTLNGPRYFYAPMCVGLEGINHSMGTMLAEDKDSYRGYLAAAEPGASGIVEEPLTLVPIYNRNGGLTATVHAWTAINANTKRPKDAFFLLDVLLSKESQQSSGLYASLTETRCVPVYEGLMTEAEPVTVSAGQWYLSAENYQAFCTLREQIDSAKICSALETELGALSYSFFEDEDALRAAVAECYRVMKMEIAE